MRGGNEKECLSQAFSARTEAIEALRSRESDGGPDHDRLRKASRELQLVSKEYGLASNSAQYGAFAHAVEIVALLCEWRFAVRNAGIDAQRFLTAAKARAAAWLTSNADDPTLSGFVKTIAAVEGVKNVEDVAMVAHELCALPLPVGIYTSPTLETIRAEVGLTLRDETGKPRPIDLTVAFVKFTIDGKPVEQVHYVRPGEAHDLDIEVRVTRWPREATHLVLEPVSVEPPGSYALPIFTLEAPGADTGLFRLHAQGRMTLNLPNHIQARPFAFKYTAHFSPQASEQPIEVVGQRELLLEGADLRQHPITGYFHIDRKLMEIRDTLRAVLHVDHRELTDVLTLAFALGNYAGQVIQGNLITCAIDEHEFQKGICSFLRQRPEIGSELEEHPHAGGGITDLSFHGIRLELKSEPHKQLMISDCGKYVGQSASYAATSGKHIGLLCVLDCSEKEEPAFPPEDGIAILQQQHASGTPIQIITFLFQGNLTKPSNFSR